ncbi:MAG: hypothetical protein RBT34_12305 [Anaerolineaceae bacterium]|jgi:hypothetical protein|nr:hypothetical protein [Anaerolineaceae bacterium]
MAEPNQDPSRIPPGGEQHTCPYLGLADDPDTQYTNPDIYNTCFKAQPPNRVNMRHQAKVCLTGAYHKCGIYQTETPGPLPRALQGKARRMIPWENWLRLSLLVLSMLALLLLAYVVLTSSSPPQSTSAASTPVIVAAVLPQATETVMEPPTPTVAQPSRTPQPSDTPQMEASQPVVQISPGPALETPFGGQQTYLVHMTLEGETLDMLAARYDTSVAVLQVVNLPPGQQGIWGNLPVVVLPGVKDASGLTIMQARQVEEEMRVADLAALYGVEEIDFRQENSLTADMVPAGRWVVLHVP